MGRNLPTFNLVCDVCGRPFKASNPRKKRCSVECDSLAKEMLKKRQYSNERLRVEAKRRRLVRDGVPESVREKVLEAKRLGVSYGKLQEVQAREIASLLREKKKAAKAGGKRKD